MCRAEQDVKTARQLVWPAAELLLAPSGCARQAPSSSTMSGRSPPYTAVRRASHAAATVHQVTQLSDQVIHRFILLPFIPGNFLVLDAHEKSREKPFKESQPLSF